MPIWDWARASLGRRRTACRLKGEGVIGAAEGDQDTAEIHQRFVGICIDFEGFAKVRFGFGKRCVW